MYYPPIKTISQSRLLTENFYGYNHNLRCDDGFFFDEKNVSSDLFPIMSVRKKRGKVMQLTDAKGIFAKDAGAYIDGTSLYYDGQLITNLLADLGERQMVSMGAYLCIFPDAYYLNTKNLNDHGYMGTTYTTVDTITYTPCNIEGAAITYNYTQSTQPQNPSNGEYWLDTSSSTHVLKQYSETTGMWVEIATVYIKITSPNIGQSIKEFDGIKISGCNYEGVSDVLSEQINALNNTSIIWARGNDYIVVIGILDQVVTQENTMVTVSRDIPTMDYVCESNNRLWGCFYGIKDGEAVNEIYACKLGDFKNWNCYMGISTDSYTVSLGSDGVFTGAVNHLGKPLFFKENCIHKIYGNAPSNYQLQTTECRGVQQGSYKSLIVVNETLFYKSRSDVVAYEGSLPTGVSEVFGDILYKDASAGAVGGKYYISMKDEDDTPFMFCYDTNKGIWHKEDNEDVVQFTTLKDELYYINSDNELKCIKGTDGEPESYLDDDENDIGVPWMLETGMIGVEYPDQKYLSRFVLRMNLAENATFKLYVMYDSDGVWELKADEKGDGILKSFLLPITVPRCDHLKIKMEGNGECKIFSLAKYLEVGSEITHD